MLFIQNSMAGLADYLHCSNATCSYN